MAENKLKIQHLRSKELVDGKPKLPTELDEGEIAINFATGHETIAIKNDSNQIVKFDNKVDENYEPTQYNGKFETLVTETNHVKAGDTNSKAFKSVENTMSTLVDEVYKNEKAIVTTFGTVGSATGIVDAEGNISYQTKADAHYIASATSVHDATVKLDNSLNGVETTVNGHQNQITAVKATADQNKTDIATSNTKVRNIATAAGVINAQDVIGYQTKADAHYIAGAHSVHEATVLLDSKLKETTLTSDHNFQDIKDLANVAGAVKNGDGAYVYQSNNNTKYIAGAHSVHEATVLLDSSLSRNENNIEILAESTGMKMDENSHTYKYTQTETGVAYIGDAVSVDDATVKLDFKLQEIEDASGHHTQDISDLANVTGGAVRNIETKRYEYTPEETANYIADATSVHNATVKLDNVLGPINTTVRQWCPISLDFVELNGVKWLTFDFNAFIGHTYHWGSLGDETQSPFPSANIDDGTTQQNPAWTAIKSIVAPLSSSNVNDASTERTRLLSPSFDIIYHLTHGLARMARESEYKSLNQNNIQQTIRRVIGPVASTKWNFSYKENPNNFITLDAGVVYKPAEIGAIVQVSNTNNIGETNSAIIGGSSFAPEGRIMGVLIK